MKRYLAYDKKSGKVVEVKKNRLKNHQAPYGYWSMAMAVNPEDVSSTAQLLRDRGVRDTKFNQHGEMYVESRSHQKELCRALGYYNRDSGYGDAAPLNYTGNTNK